MVQDKLRSAVMRPKARATCATIGRTLVVARLSVSAPAERTRDSSRDT